MSSQRAMDLQDRAPLPGGSSDRAKKGRMSLRPHNNSDSLQRESRAQSTPLSAQMNSTRLLCSLSIVSLTRSLRI